jgi:arsenite methyltransferase
VRTIKQLFAIACFCGFSVLALGQSNCNDPAELRGDVPADVRDSVLLWVGCIAGALQDKEYESKLAEAGFHSIEIEPTRIYKVEDARAFLTSEGIDVDAIAPQVDGKFMSAFVRATTPQQSCCGPQCCAPAP